MGMTESHILINRIMRANYPDLSGQSTFDFIKSFTDELQEALR